MHSQNHATKTLNNCCSLKCNAFFFFFIHTRAACLGDTENGRNIQSVGRTVETWGGMGMNREVLVSRGGNIKSKWRDERGETRHSYSTNRDCLGASRTQKHCQHASSVEANSQNRVTPHTDRLNSQWRRAQCLTQKQGQWTGCKQQQSKLPWGQTETRHTAGSAHRGGPTDTRQLHNEHFESQCRREIHLFLNTKNGIMFPA